MDTYRVAEPMANREWLRGALNTEGCVTTGLPTITKDQRSTFKLRTVFALPNTTTLSIYSTMLDCNR